MPMLTTPTPTFMFNDNDNWRSGNLESIVNRNLSDSEIRLSYIDIYNDQYPLALSTAFEFVSRNHSGRYRDRTIMSLRRWATHMSDTTTLSRVAETSNGHDRKYPILLIAEAPFSYDEETEMKKGGVIGMNICVDDGDDDWRGILCVSQNMRNKKLATALVLGFNVVASHDMSYYAHSQNFLAARTAASLEYVPVSMNSQTGVIQYRRL